MNFNFISDPRWSTLDRENQDRMLNNAFEKGIASDNRWGDLSSETQQSMKAAYFRKAEEYERYSGAPEKRGLLSSVTSHAGRGIVSAIGMVGEAAQLADLTPEIVDEDIGFLDKFGKGITDWSEKTIKESPYLRPSKAELSGDIGFVKRGVMGGIESMPLSATVAAGALSGALATSWIPVPGARIAGGTVGGLVALVTTFGAGTYGKEYKEAYKDLELRTDIDEQEKRTIAHRVAFGSAAFEVGTELPEQLLALYTLGGSKVLTLPIKATLKNMVRKPASALIKGTALQATGQVPGEMVAGGGQAWMRQREGLPGPGIGEAVKESIIPAITMSLFFGTGAAGFNYVQSQEVMSRLNSDDVNIRSNAANQMAKRITVNTQDESLGNAWLQNAQDTIAKEEKFDFDEKIVNFASVKTAEDLDSAGRLTDLIDKGMQTGEFKGKSFAPNDAFRLIKQGRLDNIFNDEDINQFKEKYPELRERLEGKSSVADIGKASTVDKAITAFEQATASAEQVYGVARKRVGLFTPTETMEKAVETYQPQTTPWQVVKKGEGVEVMAHPQGLLQPKEPTSIFELQEGVRRRQAETVAKERELALQRPGLPLGQGFEYSEPKPETRLRKAPATYPEGAEYVVGKPAPEGFEVEHKPILRQRGKEKIPWKTMAGAETALKKSERLKALGISVRTHKIVKAPGGGYQIIRLSEKGIVEKRKVKEKAKGDTLLSFVRAMGGIKDASLPGEIRALSGKETGVVGLTTKRTDKGLGFDEMAATAVEHGWLPENLENQAGAFSELLRDDIFAQKEKKQRVERLEDVAERTEREERWNEFERSEDEELEYFAKHPEEEVNTDLDQWQRESIIEIRSRNDVRAAREIEESVKSEVDAEDGRLGSSKETLGFKEFSDIYDEKGFLGEDALAKLETWRAEKEITPVPEEVVEKLSEYSKKVKAETPTMLKESDKVNDVTLGTLVDMAAEDPAKALEHAAEATVSEAKLIEGLKNKGLKAMGEAKTKEERAEIAKNLEKTLQGIEEGKKPKEPVAEVPAKESWEMGREEFRDEVRKQGETVRYSNSWSINDFSRDGKTDYPFPKDIKVGDKTYSLSIGGRKIKGRSMGASTQLIINGPSGFLEKISIGRDALDKRHTNQALRKIRKHAIQQALKSGKLTPEKYAELHEKDYGPLAELMPEVEKEPILREPADKYRQSELDIAFGGKKKADEAIESVAKEVDKVSSRRMPDRVAGEPAKSRVAEEMRKNKRVDLTDRKLTAGNESQEIAELFQVYRSPKMEILHAIYTSKDGVILGHNAMTSGNMGAVRPKDGIKYIYQMQSTAKRLGAAKVHILHNHPSGNPTMSQSDVAFAVRLHSKPTPERNSLGNLMGEFIVIDHGKFSWVSEYGKDRIYTAVDEGTYKVISGTGEWMTKKGPQLTGPEVAAAFGQSLAFDESKTCFVYVDGGNNVVGWSTHDKNILKKENLREIVKQQAKGHDAAKAVILVHDIKDVKQVVTWAKPGLESWLLDAQDAKGYSLREALPLSFERRGRREPTKPAWGLFEPEAPYETEDLDVWAKSVITDVMKGVSLDAKVKQGIKDTKKIADNPSSPEGFNIPTEGKSYQVFDLLQFKLQDRLNSLKKIQGTIEKQKTTEIPDDVNAYQTEELYHGKVSRRIEEFDANHVDPLAEAINGSGFDLKDVESYLYARHAPEANTRLEEINPKREDNKALSGMTNEKSVEIMAKYQGNKAMANIAKQVDAITKKTRKILVDEGLATSEEINAWEQAYKFYVPLKREGKDVGLPKRGTGMDIRGAESKKRLTGSSERKAVNILSNILAQHEATIIRAEKIKVGRAMFRLAKEHKSDLWKVDALELKPFLKQRKADTGEVDSLTGLPVSLSEVVFGRDILYKFKDNVFVVKIDGKEHTITFNEENVHAQRIAKGLKNLGANSGGALINIFSSVNRILAIVNTSANPEFILSNFARDIQTAGYNINDTEAKNIKARIFKDVFKAMQGIRQGIRGKYDTEWAKNYREFAKAGAQTGWIDHYKNIEVREKALKKKLGNLKGGGNTLARRTANHFFELISNENTAVENAIRLSTYIHLIRIGLSKDKAASAARNLTVNFNRKGDAGQALNAFYLFFNANIQGSTRLIYAAIKSPTVRKMMVGTVAFATMLDVLNRAIGGDDDDGEKKYDKIPTWVKEHNLILMRSNGDYFKIPLPWGYNTLHVLGQIIGEAVDPSKDEFSSINAAGRLAGAVIGSFNPLGSESSVFQVLSPTLVDPFIQWVENKNFAGIPLKPEQLPFDVPKPEYQMHWSNARTPSKWLTEKLNNLSGGDEIHPGIIDVSPEVFDLFLDTFTGGAGKFLSNTIDLPETLTKKDVDIRRIPFVRRVYGEPSEFYVRTKFYDNLNEIRYAEKSEDHYIKIKDYKSLAETRKKYRDILKFKARAKNEQRIIKQYRDQRKKIEAMGKLSKERKEFKIDIINQKIRQKMVKFNLNYKNRRVDNEK